MPYHDRRRAERRTTNTPTTPDRRITERRSGQDRRSGKDRRSPASVGRRHDRRRTPR